MAERNIATLAAERDLASIVCATIDETPDFGPTVSREARTDRANRVLAVMVGHLTSETVFSRIEAVMPTAHGIHARVATREVLDILRDTLTAPVPNKGTFADGIPADMREELCICPYTHDDADNETLIEGCDRYLDQVLAPVLARHAPTPTNQ